MMRLVGHEGTIHALAFAPDGRTLFSAGADGTIRIWDPHEGRESTQLVGHGAPVLCLAVHPRGRAVASGAADGCLKLWDVTAGQPVESYAKQLGAVTGVAWLGQRTTLAMTCGERMRPERPGELKLWNFDSKSPARGLRTEEQGLWSLAAANDGTTIAFSGGARSVVVWDLKRQEPTVFRQMKPSLAVALSPDGLTLASAADRAIAIWDVASRQQRATLEGHRGLIRVLRFSPCGRLLFSGGQDEAVRVWPARGSSAQGGVAYHWPAGPVHALAIAPNGTTAAVAGEHGSIWLWDVDE